MTEPNTRFEYQDEEVRQAYRALPDDEVPAALDQSVIAAAGDAIAQKRRPAWRRWSAPIALAASLTIVIAIVLDPGARKTADLASAPVAHQAPARKLETPVPASPMSKPEAPSQSPAESSVREQPAVGALLEKKARVPAKEQEDVVVTAQRRQEYHADVPVAITSLPYEEPDSGLSPPPPAEAGSPAAAPAHDGRADAGAPLAQAQNSTQASPQKEKKEAVTAPSRSSSATDLSRSNAPAPELAGAMSDRAAKQEALSMEEIVVTAMKRDSQMSQWLHEIHTLQTEGKRSRASWEIRKFKRAYPNIDVDVALKVLSESEGND